MCADTERHALLIDAHVHLHDCFPPGAFLEHAYSNFEDAGRQHDWEPVLGALMLTECAGVDWFGRLASEGGAGDWTIVGTRDPNALLARSRGRRLFLIAGRQVAAREGLEVLLLGTQAPVADGRPIREVLAEGEALGALPVIPWGAGKWFFRRGRLLSSLIEAAPADRAFFLGDGSGRPFFWREPRHFREAERHGHRILPGTDPLPFPEEVTRAGSFGFRLAAGVDLSRPGEGIKAALRDPAAPLLPYGRLERLATFLRHQFAMQRVKRRRLPR